MPEIDSAWPVRIVISPASPEPVSRPSGKTNVQRTWYAPGVRLPVTATTAGAAGALQVQGRSVLSGRMTPLSTPLLKKTWSLISVQYIGAVDARVASATPSKVTSCPPLTKYPRLVSRVA